MAALVKRTLAAQAHHARVALSLGQLQAVDNAPELAWRLARREAYDSLSALVLATQRSLSEPRAVRPPLVPLEHLQAHSYQLLAQLTAVKTLLLLRRGRLQPEQVQAPLAEAGERISALLSAPPTSASASSAQPCTPTPANAMNKKAIKISFHVKAIKLRRNAISKALLKSCVSVALMTKGVLTS